MKIEVKQSLCDISLKVDGKELERYFCDDSHESRGRAILYALGMRAAALSRGESVELVFAPLGIVLEDEYKAGWDWVINTNNPEKPVLPDYPIRIG